MSRGLGSHRHVVLRVGEACCLLAAEQVARIVHRVAVQQIPGAGPEVAGLAEVEGEPVAVLELGRLLGVGREARPDRPVTVVLRAPGAEGLALAADEALHVVGLDPAEEEAVDLPYASAVAEVTGLGKVPILDIGRIARSSDP